MGVSDRRAREKEALRKKILGAATELFVREGYSQVSIRKIAERIEYAPSTIYLYFRDKAEIVSSICSETFAELSSALERIKQRDLDPLTKLRASLRAYIRFGLDHPNHYVVTFCLPMDHFHEGKGEDDADEALDAGLGSFQRLREGIGACMDAGAIRRADIEVTSQSVWATIHGLTSLLITHRHFPFVEQNLLIDATVDRIVAGLAAGGRGRGRSSG